MDGKTKNRDLGITAELGRGAVILFVRYVKPKAVPACWESGCECNEQTKGERLKAAKCRELFPPQSAYADSSPARGGAFWCSANTVYSAVPLAERSFQRGYGGRQGA